MSLELLPRGQLFLRMRVRPEDLRRWSPTEIVIDSVQHDQFSAGGNVRRMSTGAVEVSSDTASVLMKLDGTESQFSFTFSREGGRWKFRMVPLLEAIESTMRAAVQERHLTNRTFVDQALAAEQSDPDEIATAWKPMGSQ